MNNLMKLKSEIVKIEHTMLTVILKQVEKLIYYEINELYFYLNGDDGIRKVLYLIEALLACRVYTHVIGREFVKF